MLRATSPWLGAVVRPLQYLIDQANGSHFGVAADFIEGKLLPPLLAGTKTLAEVAERPAEARDLACTMMRVYTGLGKMDRIRSVFSIGMRDLPRKGWLNACFFDTYLEILLKRTQFSKEEVLFVLETMAKHNVAKSPQTYLFLIEAHLRMGLDPSALWYALEAQASTDGDTKIIAATARCMLLHVVPVSSDQRMALQVVRRVLALDHLDRPAFAAIVTQWMGSPDVAPEHSLWLLFEFEHRCVLEKLNLSTFVQKRDVVQLLLLCAKCADVVTCEKLLSFMDRHLMPKTADVLALAVMCMAQAEAIESAIDVVELMARKGYLELTDAFKPYTVDVIHYTMERHFLACLADAMHTSALAERGYAHALARREAGKSVTLHTLDTVVLAWSKLGDEDRARDILDQYVPTFSVPPNTNSYNCLLLASVGTRKTSKHREIFEQMISSGVAPNARTFRLLIRQAVNANDIDEAVRYVEVVSTFQGLRIEIEMVLPIVERAGRAGDVQTVNRISKFALDCDLGIDSVVLGNVIQWLNDHGCDTSIVEGHLPLHETLRSRSKAARRRTKYDVGL